MSFTSSVKEEAIRAKLNRLEACACLSAIMHNIGVVSKDSIKITTENSLLGKYIATLLKEIYDITPKIIVRKGYNFNKNYLYILEFTNKIAYIIEDLSLGVNIPKEYLYDDSELLRSYLKGLFLAVGSINDPQKSRYHLEFLVDSKKYAYFIMEKLNSFNLNSKVLKRETKYMIYVKESEKISDFLRLIGTSKAVMYYEDIRIYRDHVNMTNRLNNCEQANVEKTINAANEQIKEIMLLKEKDVYDLLDDKVREVAVYRLKYPDVSLTELSEIISVETGKKITKSGLHHRMRKIKDMANRVKNM